MDRHLKVLHRFRLRANRPPFPDTHIPFPRQITAGSATTLSGERLHGLGHSLLGAYLIPRLHDEPLLVDEKGRAHNTEGFFSIHVLFLPHAVPIGNLMVPVRQEREAEAVLLIKFLLRCRGIGADPHHGRPHCLEVPTGVPYIDGLRSATRRKGFGIKIEKQFLTLEIGELDYILLLVSQFKRRRLVARLQLHRSSSSENVSLQSFDYTSISRAYPSRLHEDGAGDPF